MTTPSLSPYETDLERIVAAIRNGILIGDYLISTTLMRTVSLTATTASTSTITISASGVAIASSGFPRPFSLSSVTNDISVTGPAANGRDQSSAFGAAAHVTFWAIVNKNGTVATISSVNSQKPTLPTGYTHYCYLFTLVLNASNIQSVHVREDLVMYDATKQVVNAGTGAYATSFAIDAFIPYTAKSALYFARMFNGAAGAAVGNIGHVSGTAVIALTQTQNDWANSAFELPVTQTNPMYYGVNAAGAAMDIYAIGYREPNGGYPG